MNTCLLVNIRYDKVNLRKLGISKTLEKPVVCLFLWTNTCYVHITLHIFQYSASRIVPDSSDGKYVKFSFFLKRSDT